MYQISSPDSDNPTWDFDTQWQTGNDYFSGNFTYQTKLLVMTNSFKDKENDPDYMVYITKKDEPKAE